MKKCFWLIPDDIITCLKQQIQLSVRSTLRERISLNPLGSRCCEIPRAEGHRSCSASFLNRPSEGAWPLRGCDADHTHWRKGDRPGVKVTPRWLEQGKSTWETPRETRNETVWLLETCAFPLECAPQRVFRLHSSVVQSTCISLTEGDVLSPSPFATTCESVVFPDVSGALIVFWASGMRGVFGESVFELRHSWRRLKPAEPEDELFVCLLSMAQERLYCEENYRELEKCGTA
ncbi:hypothetical protein DNTS_032789 [Danionella cerebrum]|uniref:Uncharacterized protein n=1 Tax=Danionella cerebrum TaxID=2873325 RepID=A0A553R4M1_9TELE|nr:hypothetical protein DNTS_032789 [Danionella translucida]